MNAIVEFPTLATLDSYNQLEIEFDGELNTLFSWMRPAPRPCFNSLDGRRDHSFREVAGIASGVDQRLRAPAACRLGCFRESRPRRFQSGGDLGMFIQAIMRRDRELLADYAHLCVENIHRRATGFGAQITTIALVQGKALGGGFECALASDVIVRNAAQRSRFPRYCSTSFPGMGALSFLGRRIGLKKAEDLIIERQVFTAKEMRDLGVVDELAEDGLGLETTRRLIAHRQRRSNAYRSLQLAKQGYQPLALTELQAITDVWVNAALQLETRDLRMMARLVKAQDRMMTVSPEDDAVEAIYSPVPQRAVSNG